MSKDAALDLLAAVRAALIADTFINTKVAGRVFSSWGNQEAAPPLIRMSIPTARKFEIDGGGDGSETAISVHVFTAEDAPIVCRQIASKVRDVLEDSDPLLTGSNSVAFQFRDIIQTDDPDSPSLQMAVVRFSALTTAK